MDQKSIGKARWARARAASLWQQADDLDGIRSGDWRAKATRRRGADRLRAEAARFDGIANRLDPWWDDLAAASLDPDRRLEAAALTAEVLCKIASRPA